MNAKEKQTIQYLIFISLGLIFIYLLLSASGLASSVSFLGISGETMEVARKIFDVIRGVILFIIIVYWVNKAYIKKDSQKYEEKARTEYHVLLALLIFNILSYSFHFIILLLPR